MLLIGIKSLDLVQSLWLLDATDCDESPCVHSGDETVLASKKY